MMKYFYTDALAVVWMADKFKMNFSNCDRNEFHSFEGFQNAVDDTLRDDGKVYVHPDSLHLLNPKGEDLIKCTVCVCGAPDVGREYYELYKNVNYLSSMKFSLIIQHNGLAFMWPESE